MCYSRFLATTFQLFSLDVKRWREENLILVSNNQPPYYLGTWTQYAEWDLDKTSKTFTETLTALFLMA